MIKKFIPLIISGLILASLIFIPSCANTTEAPSGGPRDSIPPYIVNIKPLPGDTCVSTAEGNTVEFVFDEYVTIKNQNSIIVSPPLAKKHKSKIRNKSLLIDFESELLPNTTYTINLNDGIADNNEGNLFPGYTYVFSTGPTIDSMMMTGQVYDCSTLLPVKDASVMLYKNHSDSAVFNELPYALTKTDDWGFFVFSYIQDTLYRLYAIKDDNYNNNYDPGAESVAFADSLVRPVITVNDSIPELMKYDMKDTVACMSRKAEYEMLMFKELSATQSIVKKERVSRRASYITFFSRFAWIDSLWVQGYKENQIITQFNPQQDSLEVWINDRAPLSDTLNLYVNYRKTDTLGKLQPVLEMVPLVHRIQKKVDSNQSKKAGGKDASVSNPDSTCVFQVKVSPETLDQKGFELYFTLPLINAKMDSIQFYSLNPKLARTDESFTVERDSMNILHYSIKPKCNIVEGYEYYLKFPQNCFRDINGSYSDSLVTKTSLPNDESLSSLTLMVKGVDGRYLVELLDKTRSMVIRDCIIEQDEDLQFKYIKPDEYTIRITCDKNRNFIVDSGVLLEHKQPESVWFYKYNGGTQINIPPASELYQRIDIRELK